MGYYVPPGKTRMILEVEDPERLYDGGLTKRSDGFCRVNDQSFLAAYLDTGSVNEPTIITTYYDNVRKTQQRFIPEKISVNAAIELKAVNLEDDKCCFVYIDSATNALFAKVATIDTFSATFGAESADLLGASYTAQYIDAIKLDSTHIAIILYLQDPLGTIYLAIQVIGISGTTVNAIGNILIISDVLNTILTDDFTISRLTDTSFAGVYLSDNAGTISTAKFDVSGVITSLNQTPLILGVSDLINEYYFDSGICGLEENKAFLAYMYDYLNFYCYFLTVDYSGAIPVVLYRESAEVGSNIAWKLKKISNGSILAVLDDYSWNNVDIWIFNIYGKKFQANYYAYEHFYWPDYYQGCEIINNGEFVLFSADNTSFNCDCRLGGYLGGISTPEFTDFNDVDFGIVEIGKIGSYPVTFQNDGIYPEILEIDSGDFKFNDDDGLLSQSASILLLNSPILLNNEYNFLVDAKKNFLKCII